MYVKRSLLSGVKGGEEKKMMEEFGGGGHLTVAGAQLVDVSLDEAKNIIRETLKYLESKGDI